uniref:SCAN box domain-containing protein n=1 Tax=Varanus komodoensis TaxID=61221 RepID=A0A8D2KRK2_VARKO
NSRGQSREKDGKAQQAWRSLDHSQTVKVEVLGEEDTVSSETRRKYFRLLPYCEAEGPREICRRLQELCRQWLTPEKHTKEQILELLILEQFLTILPREMQGWVKERGPETCAEAVVLAEDFLLMSQGTERDKPKVQASIRGSVKPLLNISVLKFCPSNALLCV